LSVAIADPQDENTFVLFTRSLSDLPLYAKFVAQFYPRSKVIIYNNDIASRWATLVNRYAPHLRGGFRSVKRSLAERAHDTAYIFNDLDFDVQLLARKHFRRVIAVEDGLHAYVNNFVTEPARVLIAKYCLSFFRYENVQVAGTSSFVKSRLSLFPDMTRSEWRKNTKPISLDSAVLSRLRLLAEHLDCSLSDEPSSVLVLPHTAIPIAPAIDRWLTDKANLAAKTTKLYVKAHPRDPHIETSKYSPHIIRKDIPLELLVIANPSLTKIFGLFNTATISIRRFSRDAEVFACIRKVDCAARCEKAQPWLPPALSSDLAKIGVTLEVL
jgi:hypothetical protein